MTQRIRRLCLVVVGLLVVGLAMPVAGQEAFACVDVHVAWARGSGLGTDSSIDFQPYRRELDARIDTDASTCRTTSSDSTTATTASTTGAGRARPGDHGWLAAPRAVAVVEWFPPERDDRLRTALGSMAATFPSTARVTRSQPQGALAATSRNE